MLQNRLKTLDKHGLGFDVESFLIRPGNLTPPLVLGSVAWFDGQIKGALLTKEQTLELFAQVIDDVSKVLIGANLAYDLGVLTREFALRGIDVLPAIFTALMGEHGENMTGIHDGRVLDIQHAEALNAIAIGMLGKDPRTGAPLKGRYSQDQVIKLLFDRDDAKKNDKYRLRYGEFDNVPLEDLPPEAQQYPVDDVNNALQAGLAQCGHLPKINAHHTWGPKGCCVDCGATGMGTPCWVTRPHLNQHDLAAQTATAFALHMGAATGFKIDQSYVDIIENYSSKNRIEGLKPYIEAGLIRPDGTENRSELKRLVATAYGSSGKCLVCDGTGKVASPANPKSKIICFLLSDNGEKQKTCDGTGLILHPDVPRSEKEGIGYGRSFLIESGQEFLMNYAEVMEDAKILSVYVPFLRTGRMCITCGRHGTAKDPHVEGCAMAGWQDIPLTLRPNPILDTGRVSYDGAIQLMPRKQGFIGNGGENVPSLRECFVARPGRCFSSEDFKSGELYTHAQSVKWLLGYSDLGTALLNDVDPHAALAATVLNVSYAEFIKRKKEPKFKGARQAAKCFTFGKPGGISSTKLVISQRAQGPDTPAEGGSVMIDDGNNLGNKVRGYKGLRFCVLMNGSPTCGGIGKMVTKWGKRDTPIPPTCRDCLECADHLGDMWLKQWRENKPYFELVGDYVDNGMVITEAMLTRWPWLRTAFYPGQRLEPGQIMQHWSGRLRGGLAFCALANGFFQALLGDIAKLAYRLIARECYDGSVKVPSHLFQGSIMSPYAGVRSPLYGSRPIGFFHDEVFLEHDLAIAHDAATRTSDIMRDCIRYVCPDVGATAGAEPTLMPVWFKQAECVRDEDGRLVLWRPKIGPDA